MFNTHLMHTLFTSKCISGKIVCIITGINSNIVKFNALT